ncbi:ABC transporter ATP-binding protein [Acidovorax delafieldii]|uniref:ABC transporter ATP-binding protein n=1 Tax=Acidovorax delafieldii TaxID=47920 RepID=UPI003ECEC7E4
MKGQLVVKDLVASYGSTKILQGISLDIRAGTITALLGANGAGKTTTLRAICGMLSREGLVEFEGRRIDQQTTEEIARFGIGHVPDGRGTFAGLSVAENLQLGAILRKDTADIGKDVERIYGYFPVLQKRRDQQAGTLSGGEQQMLAVGRALMSRPRLLLLDEPSFGLAPFVVRDLFAIFRRLNEERGISILLVEQNARLALALASHAYLLETGRVVFSGTSDEIQKNDSVRRAYLGG